MGARSMVANLDSIALTGHPKIGPPSNDVLHHTGLAINRDTGTSSTEDEHKSTDHLSPYTPEGHGLSATIVEEPPEKHGHEFLKRNAVCRAEETSKKECRIAAAKIDYLVATVDSKHTHPRVDHATNNRPTPTEPRAKLRSIRRRRHCLSCTIVVGP